MGTNLELLLIALSGVALFLLVKIVLGPPDTDSPPSYDELHLQSQRFAHRFGASTTKETNSAAPVSDNLGRVRVTQFNFAHFDAVPGPPDPDSFADELIVELFDTVSDFRWTSTYVVATPPGIRKMMDEERWSFFHATELFIVRRYDLQLIRDLGVSMVQGFIFGKPSEPSIARELANRVRVEAAGFACTREARHRLMRRAVTSIDGARVELKLRNISSMGALVECQVPVMPGAELSIDIVGVAPVRGIVRWAQAGKFGVQFEQQFDLGRLSPKKERRSDVRMLTPSYLNQRSAG